MGNQLYRRGTTLGGGEEYLTRFPGTSMGVEPDADTTSKAWIINKSWIFESLLAMVLWRLVRTTDLERYSIR
jgi:hypothetical protein